MKFVELHLSSDDRKIAVNPLLISAVTKTTEGITRYNKDLLPGHTPA